MKKPASAGFLFSMMMMIDGLFNWLINGYWMTAEGASPDCSKQPRLCEKRAFR